MLSLPAFPDLKHALGEERGRRLVTLVLVLLALASALAWALSARRSLASPPVAAGAPPAPPPAAPELMATAELGRLLGARPVEAAPEPAPAQRFVVLGVVAGTSGRGAALIAVDGQPARPFGVGAELAPGFVIKRLAAREVVLAASVDGPATLTLPLPEGIPSGSAPAASGAPAEAPPAEASPAQPMRRADQTGP